MTPRWPLLGFALLGVLLAHTSPEAHAQKKNNDAADLAKARQHIRELENDIRERNKRIDALEAANRKLKGDDRSDDKRIADLRQDVKERDKTIAQLQSAAVASKSKDKTDNQQAAALMKDIEKLKQKVQDLEATSKATAIHSTFYRLKKDASDAEIAAFLDKTPKTLGKLPGVRALWVGKANVRGSDAKTFEVGVVAVFDDADALRRFLDHPARAKHIESLTKSWEPLVYDLSRD